VTSHEVSMKSSVLLQLKEMHFRFSVITVMDLEENTCQCLDGYLPGKLFKYLRIPHITIHVYCEIQNIVFCGDSPDLVSEEMKFKYMIPVY
jgi:hypothetical protein